MGPEPKEVVQHSFYRFEWQLMFECVSILNVLRLPMAASQTQGGGDGGGDCYYLLMRDRERTLRMVQQLVDTLQQVAWSFNIAAVTQHVNRIGDIQMKTEASF